MFISNPCFEIWPILHFESCTRSLSREECRKQLKKHFPDYNKELDYEALKDKLNVATSNAINLRKWHSDKHDTEIAHGHQFNPWTTIDMLVQNILGKL